jgi:hypothetical protein
MVTFAYTAFVLAFTVIGGLLGIAAHYWRAHATMFAEDLGLGEPLNTLTRDDYQWEKHVIGAEWDDAGFWDPGSVRNLLYYAASGVAVPLVIGAVMFGQREIVVQAICAGIAAAGLHSPLCS